MPKDKQETGEWAVFDMNARAPDPTQPDRVLPRVHESRLAVKWALRCNEPCFMPEAEARVFLKDPAFKVLNADGIEMAPLAAEQQQRNVPATLAPHLVIAHLQELTTDALLTRVAQMRGGTRFNSQSPREKVINFIIEQQAVRNAAPRPGESFADAEHDDMSDAEAARILAAAA